jgi:hypothetical protein
MLRRYAIRPRGRGLGGMLTAHPRRPDPDGIPGVRQRRGVSSGTCHPTHGGRAPGPRADDSAPGDRTSAASPGPARRDVSSGTCDPRPMRVERLWLRPTRPGPRSAQSCAPTGMLAVDADGRGCSLGDKRAKSHIYLDWPVFDGTTQCGCNHARSLQ